jgi:hypothetical protein
MIVCEFNVNQQQLNLVEKPFLVNLSNNYLQLKFNFQDEDWEDLTKYVQFQSCKGNYLFELENDTVVVKDYCIPNKRCIFTLYGENVDTETRITCEQQQLLLKESNYNTKSTSLIPDYSPDLLIVLSNRVSTLEYNLSEDYYTKAEVDELIVGDTYTKSEIDGLLVLKSDVGHTHTSDEISDWDSEIISDFDIFCQDLADKINEI